MRKYLILLLILLIFLPNVSAYYDRTFYEGNTTLVIQQSITGKTLFTIQQISFNPGITTAEKILNITSYLASDYTFSAADIGFSWKMYLGKNNITNTDFYLFKPSNYSVLIPDYGINSTWTSKEVYNNQTGLNDTIWYWYNQTVVIGNHTEIRDNSTWLKLNNLNGKIIKSGKSYIVKEVFHKEAETGSFAIQTVPSFMGVPEPRMTWWNSSKYNAIHMPIPNGYRPYVFTFNVSNTTGTNNQTHVYGNGKFNQYFSGINFTLGNTTEIPYWFNSSQKTASETVFYVNVTTNATSLDMYYNEGNLGTEVGNASNGTNTFLFFDDFSGDLSKWDVTQSVAGNVAIVAGEVRLIGAGSWSNNGMSSKTTFTAPFVLESKVKVSTVSAPLTQFGIRNVMGDLQAGAGLGIFFGGSGNDFLRQRDGLSLDVGDFVADQYYLSRLDIKSTSGYTLFRDNIQLEDDTTWTQGSSNKIMFSVYGTSYMYADDIRVRPYASPEPPLAAWGAAEEPPQLSFMPPTPINLANSTGNFWINHTWSAGDGNVTNSYNVSVNGTWTNGSANTYKNTTGINPYGWANISVYAFNSSVGGTLNQTAVSQNTQIPNNAIDISGILSSYNLNEGETLNIDANYTDADSDTGTFARNFSQGSFDTGTGILSWNTVDGDQGTYDWQINVTDGNGSVAISNFTVIVSDSTPTSISNLANITGNYHINWTWTAGNNADDYDIQINSTDTGSDVTNLYYNDTYSAHATRIISIRSHNHTLDSYSVFVNQTTTIPNNAPILDAVGNKEANENSWLNFTILATDLDNDLLTYGTNASKGVFSTTTGNFNWFVTYLDSGTYTWYFNVTDNYSTADTETIIVTINNVNQIPPTPVIDSTKTGNFFVNTSWIAGIGNVTDGYNSTNGATWINSTLTYRNTTLSAHAWQNLTIYAYNATDNTLSVTALTNNTRIPNNIPILNTIGNKNVNENQLLSFSLTSSDDDSDAITCSTNATKGTLSNCNFNWSISYTDAGTYYWNYNINDGYGGVDDETIIITVNNVIYYETLDSSSIYAVSNYIYSPEKILKCQGINIYANYSDYGDDIVTVTAILQENDGTQTELAMVDNGGGHWVRTYGNDNTTKWGNKSVSFRANTAGGSHINTTNNHIFVYADDCSGSNIQTWRNTSYSSGYGNYTRTLFTGEKNLFTFSIQPYINYWGYTFYLLIMFTMMGIIYLKTQSVTQPIIMSFITVAVLVASNLIPDQYQTYVLMFMAAALAAIFWRLFKSS